MYHLITFIAGSFLILEIYDTYGIKDVELNKIPKKLQCSFMPKKYILKGVIIFKLPAYMKFRRKYRWTFYCCRLSR